MSFKQIEKFQCLKSSTAQGLSTGIIRIHVSRVTCPQTCLEVSQLFVQNLCDAEIRRDGEVSQRQRQKFYNKQNAPLPLYALSVIMCVNIKNFRISETFETGSLI